MLYIHTHTHTHTHIDTQHLVTNIVGLEGRGWSIKFVLENKQFSLLLVVFVKWWRVFDVVCNGMYLVSLDNYVWLA